MKMELVNQIYLMVNQFVVIYIYKTAIEVYLYIQNSYRSLFIYTKQL